MLHAAAMLIGLTIIGLLALGRGVSVEVKLGSRESLTPVGKSSSYPANLVVKAGEGRQRVYSGQWICGL